MMRILLARWAIGLNATIFIASGTACAPRAEPATVKGADAFDRHIREFRNWLEIPGLAAAIVKDGHIVWHTNLGLADVAHRIPVTDATRFWIASLTKTMSATLIMQLAEAGKIGLDDPIAKYAPDSGLSGNVLVSHLLSHTSEGKPGQVFAYSSGRFKLLTPVIEQSSGESFAAVLNEHIFAPLHMTHTLSNSVQTDGAPIANLARPYAWTRAKGNRPLPVPRPGLNAAAGVVSTVRDLAKFAAALDDDAFVTADKRAQMFTPRVSASGETLPYGLGWFSEVHAGETIVWHFGVGRGYSSLLLKVPARKLTLIALANSEAMSAAFPLVDGDVACSSLAVDFLRDVVRGGEDRHDAQGQALDRDALNDREIGENYVGHLGKRRE